MERFVEARRRVRNGVAAVSRRTFITNAAAARLVSEADRAPL